MSNITIEQPLKDILDRIDRRLENLEAGVHDIKISQARIEEKMEGVSKRLESQEFISRGVLIGLIVTIIGGAAKLFGWAGRF
ncbi:MAG: hypothetical protein ACREPR_27170 [Brasilonema sp.]